MLTEKEANGLKIPIEKGNLVSELAGKTDRFEPPRFIIPRPFILGGLGINIYSVAYPFILQVIMRVLDIIIL